MQKQSRNHQVAAVLVAAIARNADTPLEADKAFNKFCKLFYNKVLYMCLVLSKRYRVPNYKQTAEEACQDTLLNIRNKAKQYDPLKGFVFSWIAGIAANELLQRLEKEECHVSLEDIEIRKAFREKQIREKRAEDDNEELLWDNNEAGQARSKGKEIRRDPRISEVIAIVEKLSEVQQDILMTTVLYSGRLPDSEKERISIRYGIGKKSIDAYRMRAIKAVEKCIGRPIDIDSLKTHLAR
ncbi:MAG: hypothetical protein FD123_386 [Bacteroidetes bacterium]|nr:MAG: hypothetical protein FD123_386 [Bacteroidota bacterium]